MKKFWVRHFEQLAASAALFAVVTVLALVVAVTVAKGWSSTFGRVFLTVFAAVMLAMTIYSAAGAFGLRRPRRAAPAWLNPEAIPGWGIAVAAVFPLMVVAATLGAWWLILFAVDSPATADSPAFRRSHEMEEIGMSLLNFSLVTLAMTPLFRARRRGTDRPRTAR